MKAKTDKTTQAMVGQTLSALRRQFDRWRAARPAGGRIPPRLWDGAVSEVAVHGAYRVARELNLDYAVLKRRCGLSNGHNGDRSAAAVATPRFVELFTPAQPSMPAQPCAQCVVELANARGARMRVELRGSGLAGLAALCQSLWAAP